MRAYQALLRVPRFARLLAATMLARLPIGINGLAVILFLREETGSFALGGAVAGALALGTGVGAPFQGRLVDREGRRVLVPLAIGHAAGLVALIALGRAHAPDALLILAGILTGTVLPPASSVLRAQYPLLLREQPHLIPSAYALDTVMIEAIFIAGPLTAGVLAALLDPAAALLVSAVCVVSGALAFVAALPAGILPRRERAQAAGSRFGALAAPGIQTLVLATIPVGFGIGALEVALPAFADEEGHAELAGVLVAIWSLGSAAGGLVYGARPRRVAAADLHVRLGLLLPLSFLPVAFATSIPVMAVLVLPAGVLIAPLFAIRNEMVGGAAPAGAETEAYTWPLTALVGGIAGGAAVAGALADGPGWQAAALTGAAGAALGAVVMLARRGTLSARPAPAEA